MKEEQYIVFFLDDRKYALPVHTVRLVIQAVEVKPLPGASDHVLGVINVHGQLIPVVNLRKHLLLAEKSIEADDYFIIVDSGERGLALPVDKIDSILQPQPDQIVQEAVLGIDGYTSLAIKTSEDFILICCTKFPEFEDMVLTEQQVH